MTLISNKVERDVMEMDGLLDMLAKARKETGVIGIAQKSRTEQMKVLMSLMNKFDAVEDMQTVLDQKWGLDKKRKGGDADEIVTELECRKKNV